MRLENILNPHLDAPDAWADFVVEVNALGENGLDFIDWVETKVADKNFFGAIEVDVDTDAAFAEASFYVAANAFRSGEWSSVSDNIDISWL